MDHMEAVRSNAVERYTLGDLPVGQVEEFERHFFECPQCSEELRTLSVLAENARAVFLEETSRASAPPVEAAAPSTPEPLPQKPPEPARNWWTQPWAWAPMLAGLVLAVFGGYQAFVSAPSLRREAIQIGQVSEFPLYAAARGEETMVTPKSTEPFYVLYLDMTWDGQAQKAVLSNEARPSEAQTFELADRGKGTLSIRVPLHALQPGRYVLAVLGKDPSGAEKELARYPFTLRFE